MNSALQRYVEAASGLTTLTASKAEQVVKQMVRSGEAASDQVGELVDELMERQRGNREAVTALVRSETTRAVRAMGLATSKEVERLQKQVADLKRELQQVELESERSAGAPRKRSSAKKTAKRTAKKTGARTASKKSAKKTAKKTAKKAGKKTAKKAAGKKTASKRTAKKTAKKTAKRSAGGGGAS